MLSVFINPVKDANDVIFQNSYDPADEEYIINEFLRRLNEAANTNIE